METKIKDLEEQLEFMKGQLAATMNLLAAFIAASPGADVFVRDVLPKCADVFESARQRGRYSQDHWIGWDKFHATLTEYLALLTDRQT